MNVSDRNEPVIPHPERSRALVRIFELYASGQYTFKNLADKLAAEGHTLRPCHPRFTRSSLSYLLSNRFYIGELERNGQIFKGSYRLLIDRATFDACQDVLHGRNRRTGRPEIMLSGGLLRCEFCGFAIAGELIRRKLRAGGFSPHVYYRCGNNHPNDDHPKVRWREADVEKAIITELETFRLPTPQITHWFRDSLSAAFDDVSATQGHRKRMLTKRYTELKNMQDRLLNGYLNGTIDEPTFTAKLAELKQQSEDTQRQLDETTFDPSHAQTALAVYDFSQNLPEIWQGSNWTVRRNLLDCVSLNRTLSDVTLVLQKRKPFDFLAERPFLQHSRGERI